MEGGVFCSAPLQQINKQNRQGEAVQNVSVPCTRVNYVNRLTQAAQQEYAEKMLFPVGGIAAALGYEIGKYGKGQSAYDTHPQHAWEKPHAHMVNKHK